jgi:hypothetical protein
MGPRNSALADVKGLSLSGLHKLGFLRHIEQLELILSGSGECLNVEPLDYGTTVTCVWLLFGIGGQTVGIVQDVRTFLLRSVSVSQGYLRVSW